MHRTGSSLITGTLNAHPDAIVHGELFSRNTAHHLRPPFRDLADLTERDRDPVGFVRTVLDWAPGGELWRGAKHFHYQNPEAGDWMLAEDGICKIVLERENRLAMWASQRLAEATKTWNVAPGADLADLRARTVAFRPKLFRAFATKIDAVYAHYRSAAQGRVLNVRYCGLVPDGLSEIAAFLGLPEPLPPLAREKLHGSDIVARFHEEDRARVRATLAEMGREDWAVEEA
ncbi:MAG: hypothetical protein AAGI50_17100 [Pseudomonadota bacterium]